MAKLFKGNTKTIKNIYDGFLAGTLMVDSSYQRRKVWLYQDKVRLIETILLDLVIPEVFFWAASIDSDTGDMVTHIVDGQQRISSIVEFITGDFFLMTKYLTEDEIKNRYGDKSFIELSDDDKKQIWTYDISVVEIDPLFKKNDIVKMFTRLNLTNYNLNSQEKRHGKGGCFGDAAVALADLDFWQKFRVFSASDARRMKDEEYCCSIYILAHEGIIDQTNDQKINDYYDDYADEFDKDNILTDKIKTAMSIIEQLSDKTTVIFISKKTQMYTLFSFVFKLIETNQGYSSEIFERFKLFVVAYNYFRNEYDINSDDEDIKKTNENIKKYKLASSEGINKMKNRVIRFQILCQICIENSSNVKNHLRELAKEYEQRSKENDTKYEILDDEDIDAE